MTKSTSALSASYVHRESAGKKASNANVFTAACICFFNKNKTHRCGTMGINQNEKALIALIFARHSKPVRHGTQWTKMGAKRKSSEYFIRGALLQGNILHTKINSYFPGTCIIKKYQYLRLQNEKAL
jgi:hypothetical protein